MLLQSFRQQSYHAVPHYSLLLPTKMPERETSERYMYSIPYYYPRWGAVFLGDEWSIPLFRVDFLCFTSKLVKVCPNLLACDKVLRIHSSGN